MSKKILIFILRVLARLTLWRYKPLVIGVTGNLGKTSAGEFIYAVLKERFNVRRSVKNYNNEIGAPLTILGQNSGGNSIWQWLQIFLVSFFEILYIKNYPDILILEMGADKIGDIAYLAGFIRCYAGVVTAIGDIPVHVEFFQNADHMAREKANLVRSLDKEGWAVLNHDDQRVRAMARKTPAQVFTYGFDEEADLRASNFEQHLDGLNNISMSFKVDYQGSNVPVRLQGFCARHQVYAVLAGMAVGLIFKMNLVEIAQALKTIVPHPGRLRFIRGIKKTWLIDDTYNSSPGSSLGALGLLENISNSREDGERGRKIAALGDMLELGAFSEEAHRKIGAKAAKVVDILLAVGEKSIFMADEAKKNGLAQEQVWYFADSEDAGRELQDMIREGDVILVKGSQGMRMEKIVKELMAEPERAKELLVRQDKGWQNK